MPTVFDFASLPFACAKEKAKELPEPTASLRHRIPAIRAHGTSVEERLRLASLLTFRHRSVERWRRRLALAEAASLATFLLGPLVVLASGAWFVHNRVLTAGTLLACILAAVLAALGVRENSRGRQSIERVQSCSLK